jgi:hypothetical protein
VPASRSGENPWKPDSAMLPLFGRASLLRVGALFLAVQSLSECARNDGDVGAPEHFGPMLDEQTGPLAIQLWVWPHDKVFRQADSVFVNYRMANPGPSDAAYRDAPEYYYFRVIGPDGARLFPRVYSATDGMGASERILLYPGEAGGMHTINLACMPYHPYSFDPLLRRVDDCAASFKFQEPGRYLVIGQRIPPPAWHDESDSSGVRRRLNSDTLPSRADTVAIMVRPRRWWWW